jgi:DeoR/GlpR family transcriptional regulator of sugar metabolism
MIPEQRQQELLRALRAAGVLSIHDLIDRLGVSHMTVRRDIAALEAEGLVTAVQGGVRLGGEGRRPPAERGGRAQLELPRKAAIGRRAAEEVADGMTVFLDAGTTCEAVVAHLPIDRGITVVTNDFFAVTAVLARAGIAAIHTGGSVDPESGSSDGALAAATLAHLSVDLCFLSAGAWDVGHGVTTPSADKLALKRAAIASASRSVLLADSTKFGAFERYRVAGLGELDAVITDAGLAPADAGAVRASGTTLELAAL